MKILKGQRRRRFRTFGFCPLILDFPEVFAVRFHNFDDWFGGVAVI
jgi:hypothetical protein